MSVQLPDESLLLETERLEGYCVEDTPLRSGNGAIGFRFHPIDDELPGVQPNAVVWLEEDDFRLRAVRFRYTAGAATVGAGEWRYSDVAVPGGVLRIKTHGTLEIEPPGLLGLVIPEFGMELALENFRDFRKLEPAELECADDCP